MTLEFISRKQTKKKKKPGNFTIVWKLNNTLLTTVDQKEITRKIRKHLETNEKKNKTYQNLWGAVKAVQRGKLIVVNKSIKNGGKRSQVKNLSLHIKGLEKKDELNSNLAEGRKQMLKSRNKPESRKTIEQFNKTKSLFFLKRFTKLTGSVN